MAIKKLRALKIPSKMDVIHTLPTINSWHDHFYKNLSSDRDILLKEQRQEIINEAVNYSNLLFGRTTKINSNSPIIGTGHQATWHHCGILAKDVIAEAFSKSLNATNIHIVLDHDIKNETHIKSPVDGTPTNFEVKSKVPLEFRKFNLKAINTSKYPQYAFCRRWDKEDSFKKALNLENLSDSITYLQGCLKYQINLTPLYLPVSRICKMNAFRLFIEKVIKNSEDFIQIYNAGIKSLNKTCSNVGNNIKLLEVGEKNDLPFWLSTDCGKRFNLHITHNNELGIYANDRYICKCTSNTDLLQNIRTKGYHIRPKAITLMLFLRLYVCDWFIHGIGGGKYEPITDYILKHFYKRNNSAYGIVSLTSTLLDDTNKLSKINKDIQKALRLSRQMQFNPERFFNPEMHSKHVKQLLENKKSAIEALKKSDISKTEKNLIFRSIKSLNAKLFYYIKDKYENVLSDLEKLSSKKEQLEMFNQRDYFFGLFSEKRLTEIVNRTLKDECFNKLRNQ